MDVFFHGFTKAGRRKHKSQKPGRIAQDGKKLSAHSRNQRPAILPILLDFWLSYSEWRPSFRWSRATHVIPRDGHLARHHPAAGVLLDVIVRPIPNRTTVREWP
jgi:hypothetical protein